MNTPKPKRVLDKLLVTGALGICCGAAVAQYTGPAISSSSSLANAPMTAQKIDYNAVPIMPGDVVSIITAGVPELTTTTATSSGSLTSTGSSPQVSGLKVGPLGDVTLPYVGTVTLAGMTPTQAVTYLGDKLKDGGFLVDPQISIEIVESPTRIITVVGEVQKPSPVPAFGHLRLLDVISACGGFTPLASHTVTLRRVGNPDPIVIEMGVDPKTTDVTNIPLVAGDTVIVPKVGNVFVVGEVKTPEAIPLSTNTPITVMRAITMAGGLKYSAALSKARIVRTTPDNRVIEIDFDLKKLMHGHERDLALKSDDVLFIPSNSFKAALSNGGAAVAASSLYGIAYIAK